MIRVYPLRTAYISGVPHVEQEVSNERAKELTSWMGGACFTTDPDHPDRNLEERPPGRKPRAVRAPRRMGTRSQKAPTSSPPAVEAANPDGPGDEPAPATEG
jgi:hypothetical protein